MKRSVVSVVLVLLVTVFTGCSKDDETERFKLLTGITWESDELLVDGEDESGTGQLLAFLVGDAKFNKDGSGTFGLYEGTWYFTNNETQITIFTPSLGVPLTTTIVELTNQKFRISTLFPIKGDQENPNLIEISFRAKT
ncbi:MAG: hypothetical protein RBS37_02775 [Bacteroidales bacterium]|jgi:hypothetical protein|nr:hypothetical protein [Bacteroidales bacterium]